MKLNHLMIVGDGVQRIVDITHVPIPEVVDALIGVAWDEETAGQIKDHLRDDDLLEPPR